MVCCSFSLCVPFCCWALLLWSLISDQELSCFKCCFVKHLQWTQHCCFFSLWTTPRTPVVYGPFSLNLCT
ncbi:hypothetical protein B0F90DRAFT_994654 [Multifurca ochricompacta]|uniref:Secreted protein n=1 Tax=Multifurca ochricompacta TaxID=376703 RepID=A0AAD4LU22_9AGAM|nr:hypothetical protein B0F90DRAFT_994654 [Multifurca ochricompacta]